MTCITGQVGSPYDPISVESSIQYMDSEAYQQAYGQDSVWYHYRPNHKGGRPSRITRKTCVVSVYNLVFLLCMKISVRYACA